MAEAEKPAGLTLAVAAVHGESLRVTLDGPYAEELRALLERCYYPEGCA